MNTIFTVLVFVFGAGAIWGPVEVPDGKGNHMTYSWTKDKNECIGKTVISEKYRFCRLK
jgi:hypothetical protein